MMQNLSKTYMTSFCKYCAQLTRHIGPNFEGSHSKTFVSRTKILHHVYEGTHQTTYQHHYHENGSRCPHAILVQEKTLYSTQSVLKNRTECINRLVLNLKSSFISNGWEVPIPFQYVLDRWPAADTVHQESHLDKIKDHTRL